LICLLTGGSLGSVDESLAASEAGKRTGLFVLGRITSNGVIGSVCAFGRVNTNPDGNVTEDQNVVGTMYFIIRNTKVQLRQSINSSSMVCMDVDIAVRDSDTLLVYVPKYCVKQADMITECPLQVDFPSEDNCTTFYEDSDVSDVTNQDLRKLVMNGSTVDIHTILNVQVTFKGTLIKCMSLFCLLCQFFIELFLQRMSQS
jgi:hypothetical protein